MKSFDEMDYHPDAEQLVDVLCTKTQNRNHLFFRVLVGFYFCQAASMMRVNIATLDRGIIPINMYALNLSVSGTGKGFSTNIMENQVTHLFRQRFLDETFPLLAQDSLPKLAVKRANKNGTDPADEEIKIQKEFDNLGNIAFNFDSATVPAVKQLRHKLLMAEAGSLNLQIDEIGSNFVNSIELLTMFLELYDQGMIKQKLTKNTAESVRSEEIVGKTPTNMMGFGTPSKLLNGGKVEDELYEMLETGYARRCFFGFNTASDKITDMTPEQVFNSLTDTTGNKFLETFAARLEQLADVINANKNLIVTKATSILLIEYKLKCEKEADALPEHEEIRKAELAHRYFKVLKLAGAYAFIDDSAEVKEEHIYYAIKLAEESGEAFARLLTRDRPHVKLAKYLGACRRDVTLADLTEDLPFFKGTASQKKDMLTLAIAYGYQHNIVIKKSVLESIEFYRGESLKPTNLQQIQISYSGDITTNYLNEVIPFNELHNLTQADGYHWLSHHLMNGETGEGYRSEDNVRPGFNLIVLDIDSGTQLNKVRTVIKDYAYLLYTTKRHDDENNHRFRLILPTNFELKLDAKDYKDFMNNVYEMLPFDLDTQTGQRARKWLSHDGHYEYNDGALFDVLPLIPRTSKNEERKAILSDQQSMDNLERWVINNIGDGNRNNMLLRFAMVLVDAGASFTDVRTKVLTLNAQLVDRLDEQEINNTILTTVSKAISNP